MSARNRSTTDMNRRPDEGSVLPLVLVLVIIGALVVIPMLDYTIAVFRSNHVVANRTAQTEAAKGGLRMALGDPKNVFLTCDGGGDLTPADSTINGVSVTTTCTELDEVGPAAALGYAVPKGAVTMQLGADLPVSLSGTTASSGPAYPYPASPDWWATPAQPDPGAQYSATAEEDLIWTRHPVRHAGRIRLQGVLPGALHAAGRPVGPDLLHLRRVLLRGADHGGR